MTNQILRPVQTQPHYGGQTLSGRGAEKGDFLQRTEAQVRFTVLVEIKEPDTALLAPQLYRNAAWHLGKDLAGGITQLQANCRRWEIEGSRTDGNREALSGEGVCTVQPKGILVIGHTAQLSQATMKNTFELFRRNVVNPEILTFDELFERAKFIVERTGGARQTKAEETVDGASHPESDDVPF